MLFAFAVSIFILLALPLMLPNMTLVVLIIQLTHFPLMLSYFLSCDPYLRLDRAGCSETQMILPWAVAQDLISFEEALAIHQQTYQFHKNLRQLNGPDPIVLEARKKITSQYNEFKSKTIDVWIAEKESKRKAKEIPEKTDQSSEDAIKKAHLILAEIELDKQISF
jgi:hypothetical protein